MQRILMVLPVILPVIFWAAYHYHKDRHLPEPPGNLLLCFVLGLLAAGVAKAMYLGLEPLGLRFDATVLAAEKPVGLFAYAMLAIGPIEELAKLLPFVVVVLRFKAFDEHLDGIVYASFIGLGFAFAENLYYLDFLPPLEAAARGFAGPLIHILFASIWAHWITRAWLDKRSILLPGLAGFLIATVLHGGYDFLVILHPVAALPSAAIMIVIVWLWRLRLMRRLHSEAVSKAGSAAD